MKDYIPFYGSDHKSLFAIERYAMDADGHVLNFLNAHLPNGKILDIGAGNGFTAKRLKTNARNIYCLEPSDTMPEIQRDDIWVKATAECLPFHNEYFDAVYSTWAYFMPGINKTAGLHEAIRVLSKHGKIIIIDNFGNDEFCALTDRAISTDMDFYMSNGFQHEIIKTSFKFKNKTDATQLMGFYFGESAMAGKIKLEYAFNVIAYTK